ncbi:MAG: DUF4157 domain-containing protein [Proteobacteria bacterium]|nr:DUF4157 domain-containing protein [Pseudomonadota bacterium]
MKKSLSFERGLLETSLGKDAGYLQTAHNKACFSERSEEEGGAFENRDEKDNIDQFHDLSGEAFKKNPSLKFFSSAISKAAGALASNGVQAKLKVGSTDDPLEREADEVAEEIEDEPIENAEEKGIVQAKSSANGKQIEKEEIALTGGSPIPESVREEFESRMGYDFSDVRVHNDRSSEIAARSINAKAFAIGKDIAFDNGKYQPESSEGRKLLAHELTHVVQQGGARINSGESQSVKGIASKGTAQCGKNVSGGSAPEAKKKQKTEAYWKANPELLAHEAANKYLKEHIIADIASYANQQLDYYDPLFVTKKSKLPKNGGMKLFFGTRFRYHGVATRDVVDIEVNVYTEEGAIAEYGKNAPIPDKMIDAMGFVEDINKRILYTGPFNKSYWIAPPLEILTFKSI